jgi:hypothetical protein
MMVKQNIPLIIQYLKKRLLAFIFIALAIILWIIQHNVQVFYGDVIPPSVTWLRLCSYLFLFIAPYVFLLKEKRYILANIVIIGPILLVIEGTCFYLLDCPEKIKKDFALPALPDDHIGRQIGTVPYADTIIHEIKMSGEYKVFEVDYTMDNSSCRVTPNKDSLRDKYALFFGCSIAFGYGLNDDETLPFYYQEEANANSKNYASNGYGTNQMLARLQYQDLSLQAKEKDGVAFYIFFWDHIHRAIGTMDRYTSWVHQTPYYYMDGDNLVRDRLFKDGRYWVSKFYELIYQTSIVKYFEINFPNKIADRHYELVSEMILESKKTYIKQFGNEEFYVVLYPSYIGYTEEQMNDFKRYLDEKEVKYIDLTSFIEYGPKYHLNGDPHPNSELNKVLAKELYKRVKNQKLN